MPDYCSEFKCTADKCTDNCCIGWEIDIDDCTLKYYRSVNGEFGRRLKENINSGKTSSFKLLKNDRCPFLNSRNLCDIFTELGEEHLCQICTDHPRYFEWFKGVKEGGTGLGCEESARLIITQNGKFSFTETEIPDDDCEEYSNELYDFLYSAREKIITRLQDRSLTVNERIADVISYAEELQYRSDNGDYRVPDIITDPNKELPDEKKLLTFIKDLEPLDPSRPEYIKHCISLSEKVCQNSDNFRNAVPEMELYLENIAVYFIWRYFMKGVFSGEFYSYVFLMSASVTVIRYLCECFYLENNALSEKDVIRIAKEYSKETEYSDDNVNAVLDFAYNYN